MGIISIEPASRKGAHLLIQLFGGPRSGKTLTALKIARGLVGPKGRIGVLDTESGRARLYSDKIEGGFFAGELTPPYTPERYRQAIEEFIGYGVDILVIDSFSHIWEGPGGVLEQADAAEKAGAKGLLKWLKPKVEYRKTLRFLLSTRLHVILCSRGKQPVEEFTNDRGRKEYRTLPWEPIQDKYLKYEMTVVLPMTQDGRYETDPARLKAPGDIAHLFTGELLNEATGRAIGEWVGGERVINHAHELLRKRAADAAAEGKATLQELWAALSKEDRAIVAGDMDNLKSAAIAADQEREELGRHAKDADRSGLDDPFGDKVPTGELTTLPAPPAPHKTWDAWVGATNLLVFEAASAMALASLLGKIERDRAALKVADEGLWARQGAIIEEVRAGFGGDGLPAAGKGRR